MDRRRDGSLVAHPRATQNKPGPIIPDKLTQPIT
jgi:hypothetical protein